MDADGRMKGIVTVDDIVDVLQEEATEDIQKIGGSSCPRRRTSRWVSSRCQKCVVWLAVLFVGESLTAIAMGRFENEIAKAVVLSLFIPLIISSGGSGSQASTLVIRAMALGEVTLNDWWRVVHREIVQGSSMGMILAVIGFGRVVAWQSAFHSYGEHYMRVAFTVALSVVGVCGDVRHDRRSMLPFLLKRIGLDPASASAPFVATLVDVTGIVIYFTFASLLLRGVLL